MPETFVIVYVSYEQASFENRARDKSGFNLRSAGPTLLSWKPLQAGEFVPVARRAAT